MKNNEEVLNLVFKKSENIEYEVSSDGIVTILEKQDHKVQNFFRKLKFKIPMYKKMELDEYGSFIFLQIDDVKNVKELGIKLEEKYGEESHPLYERLLLFLNHIDVNCHYIEKID
ncbi:MULTISPECIES: PqqD family peptide modification chaperone [Paraclostridium]|uniref:PqqD family peptide modification chaperone n=1 Tax=Paraclostridium bifermentans TaxID=1490 RepID=A0AA44DLD9_PARBF|nr:MULTISPECIES: PqqD family peptide modification chaperone [Paraclostridium]MBN8047584.1 PqqD family peptide modification chaperone [Paraclostridium bifermentans]MBZ6004314.1 PqqD family peptide modification chaperone [Paraclostridium bifermentans]MDU0296160.1 PqqD family peptide modification chaperone [Paraclostridium sp. MRS3W1]NME09812.1 PqqD family peptide modification chaperone [Paraclostridium bifermentans]